MNTPTLKCTSDYSMFEVHPHNRDISNTKILEKSMRKFGFDPGLPMRCIKGANSKLMITHGHHRFHVARMLGIPVWYIVAEDNIPLFDSEVSNHGWQLKDFGIARARAGEQSAVKVMDYHKETGIPFAQCISLIGGESAGSTNKNAQLKEGTLKAKDNKHASDVAEIVLACKSIGIKFANAALFVQALSKVLRLKEFDKSLFLHRVRTYQDLMEPRRTLDQYLELIEFVYNRNTKGSKTPLAFLATEASRQRQKARELTT